MPAVALRIGPSKEPMLKEIARHWLRADLKPTVRQPRPTQDGGGQVRS